jgi:hypothetical protein
MPILIPKKVDSDLKGESKNDLPTICGQDYSEKPAAGFFLINSLRREISEVRFS